MDQDVKAIKYKRRGYYYYAPCPYYLKELPEPPPLLITIGSTFCRKCKFYIGISHSKQEVYCTFEKETSGHKGEIKHFQSVIFNDAAVQCLEQAGQIKSVGLLFPGRLKLSQMMVKWCDENDVVSNPLGIVTALCHFDLIKIPTAEELWENTEEWYEAGDEFLEEVTGFVHLLISGPEKDHGPAAKAFLLINLDENSVTNTTFFNADEEYKDFKIKKSAFEKHFGKNFKKLKEI